MPRGGKRLGAGRKKSSDPTVTIRVPLSLKNEVRHWIQTGDLVLSRDKTERETMVVVLSVLQSALSLKANAGGKIKKEIKKAIAMLKQLE